MSQGYDIIGDVHGRDRELAALLGTLGYSATGGVYRHASRQALFVGDLIDRGPGQREVLQTVRAMVDAGSAHCLMGNHEFNALAWATRDLVDGGHLRSHSERHRRQHQVFLAAFDGDPDGYRAALDWFWTLPLWLDLNGLRAVHACWDPVLIDRLGRHCADGNRLTPALLEAGSRPGNWEFRALETLLKGKEVALPPGITITDKEGTRRHAIRVRWWDQRATTYHAAYIGPAGAETHIPDDPIDGDHVIDYAPDAPPVFLGHYWLDGTPQLLAANVACVDYSVAKPGGRLAAYRWDGERRLSADRFVWVERVS